MSTELAYMIKLIVLKSLRHKTFEIKKLRETLIQHKLQFFFLGNKNYSYRNQFTSPIHIKISKFADSQITAEASSQTLRRAEAQAFEDTGSEIPVARNNLNIANQYQKGKC